MTKVFQNEFENYIRTEYKQAIGYASAFAEKLGVKIYLIGGIVRDLILKTPIKDVDITVEGDAVDFCQKLEAAEICKIIAIQKDLRTCKVEFQEGVVIDFASTREEFYNSGGVLPVAKNFGGMLKKDVERRDFTINTLALCLNGQEKYSLVDFYDGASDINNKKIRILHDKSFIDDPSRIVRAIKFQMRLGFEIEEKTAKLMAQYLENVDKTIPLERIKNELRQYFCINKNGLYSNLIEKKVYKLISDKPYTDFNIGALNEITKYFDFNNLWFVNIALLIINDNFENPRLNLTANEKKTLREVKELLSISPINIKDNLKIYNAFADKTELTPVIYYVITQDKSVLKFFEALSQIKVLITGNDLINLGFIPSPYFSELFEKVLKEKLNGKLQTKEEELKFVSKFLKKIKN